MFRKSPDSTSDIQSLRQKCFQIVCTYFSLLWTQYLTNALTGLFHFATLT